MNEYNIDDIMRKDATELTAEEIEYMIEWKAEQKFKEDAFIKAEEERTAMYREIINAQKETMAKNTEIMQQMLEASREHLMHSEEV